MYFCAQNGVLRPRRGDRDADLEVRGAAARRVAACRIGRAMRRRPPRIIASTGTRLVALDAKTGSPCLSSAQGGFVDMGRRWSRRPPIYKDLLITPSTRPSIRAWNARTGALVWTFNLIAQPGDPGHETWENDAWKTIGGTNVWGYLTVDRGTRHCVRRRSRLPASDYVGVPRPGDNLYGTSLVAVESPPASCKWYQQLVHHDIWDYDLGARADARRVVKRRHDAFPAWRRSPRWGCCSSSTATTASRCSAWKSVRCRRATAPGEKTSPTQPFPRQAAAARAQLDEEGGTARQDHAGARRVLQGPVGEIQAARTPCPYTPWDDKQDIVVCSRARSAAATGTAWRSTSRSA